MLAHEVALGQMQDLLPVNGRIEVEVEGFQGLGRMQAGAAQA